MPKKTKDSLAPCGRGRNLDSFAVFRFLVRGIARVFKLLFISLVRLYQNLISPILPKACRFEPTCSEYMIEAIQIHGVIKGIFLGTKRILRCHPWGGEGYDPVPNAKTDSKACQHHKNKIEE